MIESSLIAGTQPAGAASLLAGVGASIATGGTGGAAGGVPAAGVSRDGFRERFEASVGLPRPVTAGAGGGSGVVESGGTVAVSGVWRPVVVLESTVAGGPAPAIDPVSHHEPGAGDAASVTDASPQVEPTNEIATLVGTNPVAKGTASSEATNQAQLVGDLPKPVVAGPPKQSIAHVDGGLPVDEGAHAGGAKVIVPALPVVRQNEVRVPATATGRGEAGGAAEAPADNEPDVSVEPTKQGKTDITAGAVVAGKGSLGASAIGAAPAAGAIQVSSLLPKVPQDLSARPLPPGQDQTIVHDSDEVATETKAAGSASVGVVARNRLAGKTTVEAASTASAGAASGGPTPVRTDPAVVSVNTGAVATPELAASVSGQLVTKAAFKDGDAMAAIQGRSGGTTLQGARKKPSTAPDAAPAVAVIHVAAPAPGSAMSDRATLPQVIVPAPTPVVLSDATAGAPRGSERDVAAASAVKNSFVTRPIATPLTGAGTFAGALSKVVSPAEEDTSVPAQAVSVAAERYAALPKAQGPAVRSLDVRSAPAVQGQTPGPVKAPDGLIGETQDVKTADGADGTAGVIESVLPSLPVTVAAPLAGLPTRTAAATKTASGAGVASVSGVDAKEPVVNAPLAAAQGSWNGSDKPPAVAAVKGGSQPVGDTKISPAHVAPETAQNGVAALAASQAQGGGLSESKGSVTGGLSPSATARGVELASVGSGGNGLEHTTLVSTPNVLEVGVASGTNGWLKVRAEMDGTGGVAASVVATTASAAEALHKELPALSAYLRDESVGVSSLVVNRAEAGAMAQDATSTLSSGSFGPGSQAGRGGQPGANDAPVATEPVRDGVEAALRGSRFDGAGAGVATEYGRGSGGWLNVVA